MKKKKGHLGLSNSFHYTLMVLPGYIWLFMFSIVPMVGIVMACMERVRLQRSYLSGSPDRHQPESL